MGGNIIKARDEKLKLQDGTNASETEKESTIGIDHTLNVQKIPEYKQTEYETLIKGPYASHISLGADRINQHPTLSHGDGKGAMGAFASSHIDLVAGLDSVDTNKGRVPEVPVNPDAFRDASRVYISENCDVDKQFMCTEGSIGNIESKAAVVVKSDHVRIIGREGIKIITGTDTWNSKGREIFGVPTIDLIPGNISTMTVDGFPRKLSSGFNILQPVPRGDHLVACFEDMIEKIDKIIGTIDVFLKAQQEFNSKVMVHVHDDYVAKAIGVCANGNANSLMGGKCGTSDECWIAGAKITAEAFKIKTDLKFEKGIFAETKFAFLRPVGSSYINSRGVNVT
mgnify:CR=1 FL=1